MGAEEANRASALGAQALIYIHMTVDAAYSAKSRRVELLVDITFSPPLPTDTLPITSDIIDTRITGCDMAIAVTAYIGAIDQSDDRTAVIGGRQKAMRCPLLEWCGFSGYVEHLHMHLPGIGRICHLGRGFLGANTPHWS